MESMLFRVARGSNRETERICAVGNWPQGQGGKSQRESAQEWAVTVSTISAWILADSFEIVRLETDLVAPVREIKLVR